MGQIWVREFTGGLDTRRMPETTAGGVLIEAIDGHITRGGEFEKRAAFVQTYDVPGTVGMAFTRTGIVVFGSGPAVAVPTGVAYQRLQHPDGNTALIRVPSFDLNAGKIYAVGVFADGTVHHFYDGVRVSDWFDGRARAMLRVASGNTVPAVSASAAFTITSGTLGGGNLTAITVAGVTITDGPIPHTGDNVTMAAAVAASINTRVSSPDYTASSSGAVVTITSVLPGISANGRVVAYTATGDVSANPSNMNGGVPAVTSRLDDLRVNGVAIIAAPVTWSISNSNTAAEIAAAINAYVSVPEYSAVAVGDQIVILAAAAGTEPNGYYVGAVVSSGLVLDPAAATMNGGAVTAGSFTPGTFVLTIGSKMYSTSGPNMHFSGIKLPTKWTTDATGAGFIDMSSEASGAEELVAVAKYQNYVAVFAEQIIQIWYVDPNPSLNKQSQVLNNTGTVSARSVTKFGDDDLFYVNESGLRSLRARDASNSASTTDIGSPVDTLITGELRKLNADERSRIIGAIEPLEGRFWLAIKEKIFVFSYFSGANVSAWSMYHPGFEVEDMLVFGRRMHLRSGNKIYVYGGVSGEIKYDATVATARLPYLDGEKPTKKKHLRGYDAALEGLWRVSVGMDPNNLDVVDVLGNVFETTFDSETLPAAGGHTHFSLLFQSQGNGPAKLGSAIINYDSDDEDD